MVAPTLCSPPPSGLFTFSDNTCHLSPTTTNTSLPSASISHMATQFPLHFSASPAPVPTLPTMNTSLPSVSMSHTATHFPSHISASPIPVPTHPVKLVPWLILQEATAPTPIPPPQPGLSNLLTLELWGFATPRQTSPISVPFTVHHEPTLTGARWWNLEDYAPFQRWLNPRGQRAWGRSST